MPTMVDLLEKILEEQRRTAQFATQQTTAGLAQENLRTTGETSRFELEQKQGAYRADLARAKSKYPDLDPVEALVRLKSDEADQDRAMKLKEAEGNIAYRDAAARSQQSLMDYRRDKIDQSPAEVEAEAQKRVNEEKRGAMMDATLARILQQTHGTYNPDSANPDAGKAPKLKPWKPNDTQMKRARAELGAKGVTNPSPAQIRMQAWEGFSAGYTSEELAQMGVAPPDAAVGTGTPTPPPAAPAPDPAFEAKCRAMGGVPGFSQSQGRMVCSKPR